MKIELADLEWVKKILRLTVAQGVQKMNMLRTEDQNL